MSLNLGLDQLGARRERERRAAMVKAFCLALVGQLERDMTMKRLLKRPHLSPPDGVVYFPVKQYLDNSQQVGVGMALTSFQGVRISRPKDYINPFIPKLRDSIIKEFKLRKII